jgi:hypothetical protein
MLHLNSTSVEGWEKHIEALLEQDLDEQARVAFEQHLAQALNLSFEQWSCGKKSVSVEPTALEVIVEVSSLDTNEGSHEKADSSSPLLIPEQESPVLFSPLSIVKIDALSPFKKDNNLVLKQEGSKPKKNHAMRDQKFTRSIDDPKKTEDQNLLFYNVKNTIRAELQEQSCHSLYHWFTALNAIPHENTETEISLRVFMFVRTFLDKSDGSNYLFIDILNNKFLLAEFLKLIQSNKNFFPYFFYELLMAYTGQSHVVVDVFRDYDCKDLQSVIRQSETAMPFIFDCMDAFNKFSEESVTYWYWQTLLSDDEILRYLIKHSSKYADFIKNIPTITFLFIFGYSLDSSKNNSNKKSFLLEFIAENKFAILFLNKLLSFDLEKNAKIFTMQSEIDLKIIGDRLIEQPMGRKLLASCAHFFDAKFFWLMDSNNFHLIKPLMSDNTLSLVNNKIKTFIKLTIDRVNEEIAGSCCDPDKMYELLNGLIIRSAIMGFCLVEHDIEIELLLTERSLQCFAKNSLVSMNFISIFHCSVYLDIHFDIQSETTRLAIENYLLSFIRKFRHIKFDDHVLYPNIVSRIFDSSAYIQGDENAGINDFLAKSPLELAIKHGFLSVIEEIFIIGCNFYQINDNGDTLLHRAIYYDQIQAGRLLLQYISRKEDARPIDTSENTSCSSLLLLSQPCVDSIKNNVSSGSSNKLKLIDMKNHDDYTALMLAADIGLEHWVDLLLEFGADPSVVTNDGLTAKELTQQQEIIEKIEAVVRSGRVSPSI